MMLYVTIVITGWQMGGGGGGICMASQDDEVYCDTLLLIKQPSETMSVRWNDTRSFPTRPPESQRRQNNCWSWLGMVVESS